MSGTVSMERDGVVRALQATTSSTNQKEATVYLDHATKLMGFAPLLLQIIMDESVDCSARQAAVIYLKNVINRSWALDEEEKTSGTFVLPEQDKHIIREHIIDAIVASPEAIRVQLCTAVGTIMRHDFPKEWPHLPQKVTTLLHSVDGPSWLGALLVVRRLVKLYEYRRVREKKPLVETMTVLLPMLLDRLVTLMADTSQESCLLQKIILKIFYGLVQFSLNMEMLDMNALGQWMEQLRIVIERRVPPEVNAVEEDDRQRTVWWKCKKWASATTQRIFERYGSPGQVESDYTQFAENYMAHFAVPTVNTCLGVLDRYRNGEYVSPRVLHSILQYVSTAVSQSHTWKVIKPHCQEIVQTIIFPLMKHTDEDEELWSDSPEDYVRLKYDLYDELHNPSVAAVAVLASAAKRKDVLQPILQFVLAILNSPDANARDQDGALRLIGELSSALIKNKLYKKDVEKLVEAVIVPRIANQVRFLRARACWAVKEFSDAKFTTPRILQKIVDTLVSRVADPNEELPVKVEAAIAVQLLLHDQPKVHAMIKPHVRVVVIEVLRLVARAEIEEMTAVMDELMEQYVDDVVPIAVDVTTELANIFLQLTLAENQEEDRTVTIMGILSTLGSVLEIVEENSEVMAHVEVQVLRVIKSVLDNYQIDYFEEILALTNSLILTSVSEPMWEIFFDIHKVAVNEGGSLFVDMMPVLHSYLTVDTDSFLARPERVNALVEMAVNMFNDEFGEDDQIHAAKLLECLILQCQGRIDNLVPDIVQLAITRLHQPFEDGKELRPMLLLVICAGLYYNSETFVSLAPRLQPHTVNTLNYIVNELVTVAPKLSGIHDRKMAIIALCTLARLAPELRPSLIDEQAPRINEEIVALLDGLQKAMKSQAESRLAEEKRQEQEGSEDDEEREEDLADSEDEIDEGTLEYLETLAKHQRKAERTSEANTGDSEETESDSGDDEEWDDDSLEAYFTPIDDDDAADAFVFYKETLETLQKSDERLLMALTTCSDAEKASALQKILTVCGQRVSLAKSKKVEQQGGYAFNVDAPMPTSFNFSGGPVS
uniref:Importin N-terminal domain-containing protein n=1 Tax=Parascaris univalens TaxID=6257 RepID=A0A915AS39_PARUN